HFYGERGIADYTYALSVCAPFYFLTSLNFGLFLAVHGWQSRRPREFLALRLLSALASVPLLWLLMQLLSPELTWLTMAMWTTRVAEMLFDPVVSQVVAR